MSYPAKRLEVEVKQDPKAEDTNVILNKSMKDDRKDSSLGQHYSRIPFLSLSSPGSFCLRFFSVVVGGRYPFHLLPTLPLPSPTPYSFLTSSGLISPLSSRHSISDSIPPRRRR